MRRTLKCSLALLILIAAGLLAQGIVLDSELVGFRPGTRGFSFENYTNDGVVNLTPHEMQRLFGNVVYEYDGWGNPHLTYTAREWMQTTNRSMNNGHCEGMAVLPLLYYWGQVGTSRFGADRAFDMSFRGNEVLQREIALWFATQNTEPTKSSEIKTTPVNVVNILLADMPRPFSPTPLFGPNDGYSALYTLGIYKRGGGGGHAMTPYGVAMLDGGNTARIYHYDNNYPNNQRYITVDMVNNTWQYEASTDPSVQASVYEGDASTRTLTLTPIYARRLPQSLRIFSNAGFARGAAPATSRVGNVIPASAWSGSGLTATAAEIAAATDTIEVSLSTSAASQIDILIVDTQGRRAGFVSGALINEIPNVVILQARSADLWSDSGEPIFAIPPRLAFSVQVSSTSATETEDADITLNGNGFVLGVKGLQIGPGQRDTVFFSPAGNRIAYTARAAVAPSLSIAFRGDSEDYEFEAVGFEADPGARLELSVEYDEGRIRIRPFNTLRTSSLELYAFRIGPRGEETFENNDVTLDSGEIGYLEFGGWSGEGAGMSFVVDDDGNGVADTILAVPDQNRSREIAVTRAILATDTRPVFSPPIDARDSFVQITMRNGKTTTGSLSSRVTATGQGADYTASTRLLSSGDSLTIPVWTNQSSMSLFVGIRSDTGNLLGSGLPSGISNSDAGRRAFGATTLLLEFADSRGKVIGDTRTTTNLGDTFAYTLRYALSETTVKLYRALGFDTAPGSPSFALYYADTYGGAWKEFRAASVLVEAGSTPGSLIVSVSGITIDLPGGLGAATSSSLAGARDGYCIVNSAGFKSGLDPIRILRDTLISSRIGRWMVECYYALGIFLLSFFS